MGVVLPPSPKKQTCQQLLSNSKTLFLVMAVVIPGVRIHIMTTLVGRSATACIVASMARGVA